MRRKVRAVRKGGIAKPIHAKGEVLADVSSSKRHFGELDEQDRDAYGSDKCDDAIKRSPAFLSNNIMEYKSR